MGREFVDMGETDGCLERRSGKISGLVVGRRFHGGVNELGKCSIACPILFILVAQMDSNEDLSRVQSQASVWSIIAIVMTDPTSPIKYSVTNGIELRPRPPPWLTLPERHAEDSGTMQICRDDE